MTSFAWEGDRRGDADAALEKWEDVNDLGELAVVGCEVVNRVGEDVRDEILLFCAIELEF